MSSAKSNRTKTKTDTFAYYMRARCGVNAEPVAKLALAWASS